MGLAMMKLHSEARGLRCCCDGTGRDGIDSQAPPEETLEMWRLVGVTARRDEKDARTARFPQDTWYRIESVGGGRTGSILVGPSTKASTGGRPFDVSISTSIIDCGICPEPVQQKEKGPKTRTAAGRYARGLTILDSARGRPAGGLCLTIVISGGRRLFRYID